MNGQLPFEVVSPSNPLGRVFGVNWPFKDLLKSLGGNEYPFVGFGVVQTHA